MTKKILAFGASSSRQSINKRLANYAAQQVPQAEVTLLDLNDFEMPIYSIDRQIESGIPPLAVTFKDHLRAADGVVISFAEHNGSYAAAFKNIFDWISRIEKGIWLGKPMFLLSTSPGGRGGKTVLTTALTTFGFQGAGTLAGFSLPSFGSNFSEEEGILDPVLAQEFAKQLYIFSAAL